MYSIYLFFHRSRRRGRSLWSSMGHPRRAKRHRWRAHWPTLGQQQAPHHVEQWLSFLHRFIQNRISRPI